MDNHGAHPYAYPREERAKLVVLTVGWKAPSNQPARYVMTTMSLCFLLGKNKGAVITIFAFVHSYGEVALWRDALSVVRQGTRSLCLRDYQRSFIARSGRIRDSGKRG